jgi:CheY-like chemotaxis protein
VLLGFVYCRQVPYPKSQVARFAPYPKSIPREIGNELTPVAFPKADLAQKWSVPPKVLLVEDNLICRTIGTNLLKIFGCSFDTASDGLDAINMMNLQRYDLVLMDIVMPNLDGLTATCCIRKFDKRTPIISMTVNVQKDDCVKYLANGMNDILPKPFNKEKLQAILERYCSHLHPTKTILPNFYTFVQELHSTEGESPQTSSFDRSRFENQYNPAVLSHPAE